MIITINTATGRSFQVGEQEKIAQLAKEYGVHVEDRNIDCYTNIGMDGSRI